MADVRLEHLTQSFPNGIVGLRDVSLHVSAGGALVLVGPSGSGKTTLLRVIAGLQPLREGTVRIAGRDMTNAPPHHRNVALVPQRPALFPHLSVADNLAVGLRLRRTWFARLRGLAPDPAETEGRVRSAAELLRIGHLLGRRPRELSGGEQQRVVLGRAIVRRAAVWLLDEPFNTLDAPLRDEFRRELPLLRQRLRVTMIQVTHDPIDAQSLGDRVAVLEAGQLRQTGSAAEVAGRPATRFAARLLGWPPRNWLDGVITPHPDGWRFRTDDGLELPLPAAVQAACTPGQVLAVGVRPGDVVPVADWATVPPSGGATLPGWRVVGAERTGRQWLATLRRGRWEWRAWWTDEQKHESETVVTLSIQLSDLVWFDGVSGRALPE
jgi:ABC-type sugar transport system ATPase subunit